ncbi:MAG: serine/threonine-protein phosphatase [Phycisphaerae bacterium]|nr:serine/threonine-protein phosphatase [Phycisphaerae bacterium]
MAHPQVQVILGGEEIPPALERALARAGAATSFRPLSDALNAGVATSADAVIIVAPEDMRPVADRLRLLLERLATNPRATLVLKPHGEITGRLKHPPILPVMFVSGLDEDDLTSRIHTMVAMRPSLSALHGDLKQREHGEQSIAERYAAQLRLASRVQRELMPQMLPQIGPFSFTTLFRPVDFVSGDIYDVQRLDDEHVGVALADAAGHGIPAALLTVFLKRALRGQTASAGETAVHQPDQVLRRLNADVIEARISECRFVAVTYALLNTRTREVAIARAGAPFPILHRADGQTTLIRPRGTVVGVMPDTTFEVVHHTLGPGDTLFLYSDGLETLLTPAVSTRALAEAFGRAATAMRANDRRTRQTGRHEANIHAGAGVFETVDATAVEDDEDISAHAFGQRMVDCLDIRDGASAEAGDAPPANNEITSTPWFASLQTNGPQVAMDELIMRHDALRRIGYNLDDLTVLAINSQP